MHHWNPGGSGSTSRPTHGGPELPCPGLRMEGDCLSCMKYLMFIFNFFIFVGGSVLLAVGGWVLFDPLGFRELVASNPLLFTGVYLLLALGSLLFLLGFLGCCGSIRENKCLLLFFFMVILFIFLSELAAAVLAFLFREHMTREFFTRELKRHYQGQNTSDVFTSTWNAVMSSFECCGVSGPQDFDDSLFRLLNPSDAVPEACCHREGALQSRGPERQGAPRGRGPGWQVETTGVHGEGGVSALELCVSGANAYHTNYKGCYSSLADYFETYIYSAGALAIIVLTIELFAMVFSMCLFRGIQ